MGDEKQQRPKILLTERMFRHRELHKRLSEKGFDTVTEGFSLIDGIFVGGDKNRALSLVTPKILNTKAFDFLVDEICDELMELSEAPGIESNDGIEHIVFDAEDTDGLFVFGKALVERLGHLRKTRSDGKQWHKAYFSIHEPHMSKKGWHVRIQESLMSDGNPFYDLFLKSGWTRKEILGFVVRHEFSHAFMHRREYRGEETFRLPGGEETFIMKEFLLKLLNVDGTKYGQATKDFSNALRTVFSESYADCRALTLMPHLRQESANSLPHLRATLCNSAKSSSHETWRGLQHLLDTDWKNGDHEAAAVSASVGTVAFVIDCIRHSEEISRHVMNVVKESRELSKNLSNYHLGNKGRCTRLFNLGFDELPQRDEERILGNLLSITAKSGWGKTPKITDFPNLSASRSSTSNKNV